MAKADGNIPADKKRFGANDPGPVPEEVKSEFQFTPEQLGVTKEFKKMVGDVLTVLEAALPEGSQLVSAKRLVQNKMYDGLKAMLGELE